MDETKREKILDVLCFNYYDIEYICREYELYFPPDTQDLGYIRNYLSENLDEILDCIDHCYCGKIVEMLKKIR